MARPRKVVQVPPAEAAFILEALMRDGRLDSNTIGEYRGKFNEEIASLEARLAHLRSLSGAAAPAPVAPVAAAAPAVTRGAKRAAPKAAKAAKSAAKKASAEVTPERARTRELQGRYLGLMHRIPKTIMKQRFGKDAIAKKGKEAVLGEMEKFLAGQKKG